MAPIPVLLWTQITHQVKLSDLAFALLCLFLCSASIQRLTTKGPMLWPVLGLIPNLFFHIGDVYNWITDSIREAGGTFAYRGVWFGGSHGVVTADPANVEYMLKTRFSNFPKGRYYRERFADFLGDGIFNSDDMVWREQRRAASLEMHSSRFVEYAATSVRDLVHRKLLVVLDRLASAEAEEASVDLQEIFLRFTFDNICVAAFGIDPGCLAVDLPEIPFARAFEQATQLTLFRFIVPPFIWKPMKTFQVSTERRLRAAIQIVHEFAEKTVSDRRNEFRNHQNASVIERSDLLSRFLIQSDVKFSDKFLKDFCISFILAGRDTSSVALAWFFWLLHRHPRVERRILDEISDIAKTTRFHNKVAKPTKTNEAVVFSVDDLKRMDYLQAALSESLRLYPSVPVDFKEALEDDVLPDGTAVRKGARVIYSIYSMARMERLWGKDCDQFRPERWLKEGAFVSESQFKYAVFNGGPRLCVGKKFAYMQMKAVAAAMLLRYRVEVVEGQEVAPKLNTTLYMKNGLRVVFKKRGECVHGVRI
ncbi:cytochrome P450 86B1 [Typha angustifolia]|uniref:cytochrome P450 86B1 n=1 Tax=Typha angustifolia TaxID=59011 RepID=UPI003C2DB152